MSSDEPHIKTVDFRGVELEVDHSAADGKHRKATQLWDEVLSYRSKDLPPDDMLKLSETVSEIIELYTVNEGITKESLSKFDLVRTDGDGRLSFALEITPGHLVVDRQGRIRKLIQTLSH